MDDAPDHTTPAEETTTVGRSLVLRFDILEPWEVQFLARAKRALDDGEPEIAVVMAATASEIFVEQLFEQLLQARDLSRTTAHEIVQALQDRTLGSVSTRNLLRHLAGVDVTTLPSWQRYRTHLTRRNNIVHGRDKTVPKEEAAKSVQAVEGLWAEILAIVTAPDGVLPADDA